LIETTVIKPSECFLKQEFLDFTKKNYEGRPFSRKELNELISDIKHECLHHKIYAIFGFKSKCTLNLELKNEKDRGIYYINYKAECALRTEFTTSFSIILTLLFVDILHLVYDIIADLLEFDFYNPFLYIRDFIVEQYSFARSLLNYVKKSKNGG
jgi:hypothetical protein